MYSEPKAARSHRGGPCPHPLYREGSGVPGTYPRSPSFHRNKMTPFFKTATTKHFFPSRQASNRKISPTCKEFTMEIVSYP